MSQKDLAAAAGLHHSHVGAIERGARHPTIQTLDKLGKALGTTGSGLAQRIGAEEELRPEPELVL